MTQDATKKNIAYRILIFIIERFNPVTHLLFISLFFVAGVLIILKSNGELFSFNYKLVLMFVEVFLIFLHLRIFDEIKDVEIDRIVNKDRPLARGLLTTGEAKIMGIVVVIVELIIAPFISYMSVVAIIPAILFSLLMYKEFFLKKRLENHLFLYALSHTPIVAFIIIFIYFALGNKFKLVLPIMPIEVWLFVIVSWFTSLSFDVGRKTFRKEEEMDHRDSYSAKIGQRGATLFFLILAVLSLSATYFIGWRLGFGLSFYIALGVVCTITLALGVANLLTPNVSKIFREYSGLFMVLVNASLVVGALV